MLLPINLIKNFLKTNVLNKLQIAILWNIFSTHWAFGNCFHFGSNSQNFSTCLDISYLNTRHCW